MILQQKKFTSQERQQHINHVYDVVGYAMQVRKELPCALPEYIYQEAFADLVRSANLPLHKEYVYHPIFRGKPMQSFIRMDFFMPRTGGDIIIEAKAIDTLTQHERVQLFRYMVASSTPYGLLVNFATYPFPQIERYYFDPSDMTVSAF